MAVRSNCARFRIKRLTFFRWKERVLKFITPIIYIRCYLSRKKYKSPTFYATLLSIPLRNSLPYQLSHDLLLMSELNFSSFPSVHLFPLALMKRLIFSLCSAIDQHKKANTNHDQPNNRITPALLKLRYVFKSLLPILAKIDGDLIPYLPQTSTLIIFIP